MHLKRVIPEKPKIGLVLSTYGSTPYVHLFLESATRNFPNIPILISDDCSNEKNNLINLAQKYNCEFESNNKRYGHGPGDITGFVRGIKWAKEKDLDIVVKMSRRFIPFYDWPSTLSFLAHHTQFFTFANECKYFGFPVRSECMGFYVDKWYLFLPEFEKLINEDVKAEWDIYRIVVAVQNTNSSIINSTHVHRNSGLGYNINYGIWEEIGNSRLKIQSNILWHNCCPPFKYHEKALEYGIKEYKLRDFQL